MLSRYISRLRLVGEYIGDYALIKITSDVNGVIVD